MSLMPTAPRSIGGVLDNAIRLFRAVLPRSLPLVIGAVVAMALLGATLTYRMMNLGLPGIAALRAFYLSPATWLSYLVILAVTVLVYNAIFVIADAVARGAEPSLGAALSVASKRWLPSIALSIVLMVIIGIGLVLLVLPGIWLWGALQFSLVALLIERQGVFASLGTSFRLVKGNWWRSVTIMTVSIIIMYVLVMVLAIAVGILTASLRLSLTGSIILQQVLSALLNLVLLPFLPTVLLSIYYDLKLRSEGTDLAARLQAIKAG
ncbi:MAG TPA: hypothetical protein VMI92_14090 [Steroidobacteraceae bacterium]|nr:hypothetical protein [Steroidobacteraceae bacterium]